MLLRPGLPELRVYSFDKHFLCPGGGWCAVSAVVVKGWLRSQDFLERLALRDQIGNPLSDNRDHLAVLDYIGLIADPSLTGNDVRAAFLLVLRNTQFDDLIESRQNTLQTAAVLPVDDGVVTVENKSPVAMTSDRRKNTRLSASVWAAGIWTIWIPSPLKSRYSFVAKVSVGHASNGAGASRPVGALIFLSTFSCATMAAVSAKLLVNTSGNCTGTESPALPIATFPPV